MLALFIWISPALAIYLAMSIITFVLYAVDKNRARRGAWRITEAMLHGCELLCGWPGALLAQRLLHHKNRKTSYQIVFWSIVTLHILFWAWRWRFVRVG
jgi:uncharacterized membrane protein YsdA (DUF1294 family)